MNIVLANRDYGPATDGWGAHTSSEGYQLQAGLERAGWHLCGVGYDDGCAHVPTLIDRYQPEAVFVQDVRDWLPESGGAFRKDLGFTDYESLADCEARVYTVLKDAWQCPVVQGGFAKIIDADGVLIYYRQLMVMEQAPWSRRFPLHRIYHSVDTRECCDALMGSANRRRAVVTGNHGKCYQLRRLARAWRHELGVDDRQHPGYGNIRADTADYLKFIAGYKVHVACASHWGAAFRKIIESVAVGCTPITDLPASDVLPEIDGALVRVSTTSRPSDLLDVIDQAERDWNVDERMYWAERAIGYYDWAKAGERAADIMGASIGKPSTGASVAVSC